MRLKLKFKLDSPNFQTDQSRIWISFFKKATKQYDICFYQRLFEAGIPLSKSYTYSPYFNVSSRKKDEIQLQNTDISLIFSSHNLEDAMLFANAFIGQLNCPFPLPNGNTMTLQKVELITTPTIETTEVMIKFLNPFLILGNHPTDEKKRWYYQTKDINFTAMLHQVIQTQIQNLSPNLTMEGFELIPIHPRWTVVHAFGQRCAANFGTYQLKGHPDLLNFLFNAGFGSRRNAGFGCFEIIN